MECEVELEGKALNVTSVTEATPNMGTIYCITPLTPKITLTISQYELPKLINRQALDSRGT